MANGIGRVMLVLGVGSASVLAGCGTGAPIAFHRVVSPCIEMPGVVAQKLDGKNALERMLTQDFTNKDADQNGELTLSEVKAGDTRPNLVDQELFERLDQENKDPDTKGKLTLDQVKGAAGTLYKWAGHYKLKLMVRFDATGDRFLEWAELKGKGETAYFDITEERFKEADDNGDNKLNPDEFLNLVLTQNADACGAPAGEAAAPAPAADTAASSLRRYGQPAYGQPAYGQPAYGQPAYGQPAYGQPAYGQPAYGQPAYGQPAYRQPAPPAYRQPLPPQARNPYPPVPPRQQPVPQPYRR